MNTLLAIIKKILPAPLRSFVLPLYHRTLAFLGALAYRFPSRHITVVAVTGTKGKSSVVELLNTVLETAGYKTALLSTIHFKVGRTDTPNRLKMTTPGRFFVQRFLRRAVAEGCSYAILEMTSEAARQFRHTFIAFDALIFTNLSPEHIESHGSYEKYVLAKLSIGKALERSTKEKKVLVVNEDEKEAEKFLQLSVPEKLTYALKKAEPYSTENGHISFTFAGEPISTKQEGLFNIYNCLAAATFAKSQGISTAQIKQGLERDIIIKGRVEHIDCGQDFDVIVDYAHTPDSLEKLYKAFPDRRKVAVLGNTGGGRDTWKRPVMASIAEKYCENIFLTNEDPYDEDPVSILSQMAKGMTTKKPHLILDRREAIRRALQSAGTGSVVFITGKGTDPCIMGPNGSRVPWDDAIVAREELAFLRSQSRP